MSAINDPVAFRPVFCPRGDGCGAQRDLAFCASCGADIAAYLRTVTSEHEAASNGDDPTLTAMPTPLWSAPSANGSGADADTSHAHGAPAETPTGSDDLARPLWRHALVLGGLGAGVAVGAVAGVLADLV
jgi:hypothetical protein